MANVKSIHSVCNSIIQFLHNAYEAYPAPFAENDATMQEEYPCEFRVMSSGELDENEDMGTSLTLYLYRVTMNEHIRAHKFREYKNSVSPLSLDLHFLITVWANSSDAEHTICAWVMNQLHQNPIMDVSSLTVEGGWRNDDVVQIIPAELSNEDLMRVWDTLAPNYRLSISFIARVVRIEPDVLDEGKPVVATRYQYEEKQTDAD